MLTLRRMKPRPLRRAPVVELVHVTCRTSINVSLDVVSEPLVLPVNVHPPDRTRNYLSLNNNNNIYKLYFAKMAARYKKVLNTKYTKKYKLYTDNNNPMLVIGVNKRNKQWRVHQS